MTTALVIVLAVVAVSTAHYDGYPFVHKNDGKYGAAYPYANYNSKKIDNSHSFYFGGSAHGDTNYELSTEPPVQEHEALQANSQPAEFYFLGSYDGGCQEEHPYGFYTTADDLSFVVCDHGYAHRFQCPVGTKNSDHSAFQRGHVYDMHELCSVNINNVHDSNTNRMVDQVNKYTNINNDNNDYQNI